jgi:hypothetical protein
MSPIHSILHQSALHLVTYALVASALFASVWQAFTLAALKHTLRAERERLWEESLPLDSTLHPVANALRKMSDTPAAWNGALRRRVVEHCEAALFLPLKAKITLTRDLSTLMGLVATCTALVTAGADFARNGRAELLIGSVASGTISTCIAAIGCMISLWNASRLLRLRLQVASEIEDWLLAPPLALASATATPALDTHPVASPAAEEEVLSDPT